MVIDMIKHTFKNAKMEVDGKLMPGTFGIEMVMEGINDLPKEVYSGSVTFNPNDTGIFTPDDMIKLFGIRPIIPECKKCGHSADLHLGEEHKCLICGCKNFMYG